MDTLPKDWIPAPLGTRLSVSETVQGVMRTSPPGLALTVTVEAEEDSSESKTRSVLGVLGEAEMGVILALCLALAARFYDAETADFIKL